MDTLTDRERTILQLMADGLTRDEIAGHLGIALATVKSHRKRLIGKLGAHTSTYAVPLGFRANLIR